MGVYLIRGKLQLRQTSGNILYMRHTTRTLDDILSALKDFSTSEGYHEDKGDNVSISGVFSTLGDIMNTSQDVNTGERGTMIHVEGYHECIWIISTNQMVFISELPR